MLGIGEKMVITPSFLIALTIVYSEISIGYILSVFLIYLLNSVSPTRLSSSMRTEAMSVRLTIILPALVITSGT